jgi:hypothetical protein
MDIRKLTAAMLEVIMITPRSPSGPSWGASTRYFVANLVRLTVPRRLTARIFVHNSSLQGSPSALMN